jgi:hypothetical protein
VREPNHPDIGTISDPPAIPKSTKDSQIADYERLVAARMTKRGRAHIVQFGGWPSPGLQIQFARVAVDGQRDRAGPGPAFQARRYNVDTIAISAKTCGAQWPRIP